MSNKIRSENPIYDELLLAQEELEEIRGMPIINVHQAKTVFALKRGQGAGFSGLVNTLFFRDNCRMIYGDAKATVSGLVSQFDE